MLCCLYASPKALETHGTVEKFKEDLKRQSLKRASDRLRLSETAPDKERYFAGNDSEFKVKTTFGDVVQSISHHTTPHHHITPQRKATQHPTTQHATTQHNTQHHTPAPHHTTQHSAAVESKVKKANYDSFIKKL